MIPEDHDQESLLDGGPAGREFVALTACLECGDLAGGRGLMPLYEDEALILSTLVCFGCDYVFDAVDVAELDPEMGLGIVWTKP